MRHADMQNNQIMSRKQNHQYNTTDSLMIIGVKIFRIRMVKSRRTQELSINLKRRLQDNVSNKIQQ